MMSDENPEIGQYIETCGYQTNVHDLGSGPAILFLHGSGAGVSGYANWRGLMPIMQDKYRVVVIDEIGFGYTETPPDFEFKFMDSWNEQAIAVLDKLGIEKAHLVGNSFGGSIALQLAAKYPDRVDRVVLMGSGGVPFKVRPELVKLWGYEPSVENMKEMISLMAFNQDLVTDDIAEMRYKATIRPGVMETFQRVFPPPYQRWLDAQCLPVADIRSIEHQTLIIHGRDDRVVPVEASITLNQWIPNSQLHLFGNCGHWTMVEMKDRFIELCDWFFSEGHKAAA